MLKLSSGLFLRLGPRTVLRYSSTSSAPASLETPASKSTDGNNKQINRPLKEKNLVAAAFENLSRPDGPNSTKKVRTKSPLYDKISQAKDIEGVLKFAEQPIISRKLALKMMSSLSELSTSGKAQLSDFGGDWRFLKLCRLLGRTGTEHAVSTLHRAEDVGVVMTVAGDDEAARLATNLTVQQNIKVMAALVQKKRRSTPLLRAISYNITESTERLDLKQSADLLYYMAALNFPDDSLIDRICGDVLSALDEECRASAVARIVTSLGHLRYRHVGLLAALARWLERRAPATQHAAAAIVTLATLDCAHGCDLLIEEAKKITPADLSKASCYLDLVFSLVLLGQASQRHLETVLAAEFIDSLYRPEGLPIPVKIKLQLIDSYLSLKHNKSMLSGETADVTYTHSREKQIYVQCIMDTFKYLISTEAFLKKNCNSGMGFLYDAEFALDSKCNPVPLEKAENNKEVTRIAVMGLGYHDMCRKSVHPLGVFNLYEALLNLKGYKVMFIPYTEFDPKDKVVDRVRYIEKRMKALVQPGTTQAT